MGRQATKKRKSNRGKARQRRIQRGVILGCVLAICAVCIAMIVSLNRPIEPQSSWYVSDGALEIAAPASGSDFRTTEGRDPDSGLTLLPNRVEPTKAPTAPPTEAPTPAPSVRSLTITAAGDCTLGGSVHQDTYLNFKRYVQNFGYDYFFSNVRPVFEADDLTIINLEGPITDVGKARHGSYVFKGDPDYTAIMTGSSVELCNVANNHSQDFGTEGLERTEALLDQAGIGWCGYEKVFRTQINGIRVSALGYLEWEIDKNVIVDAVRRERPNCDILIVNMHWGREKHYEPVKAQKTYGHAIIDAGADLIIGTHPHVYGGIELYNGKYIVYSLGNFCFGGNANPTDKRCLMFQQTFNVSPEGQVTSGGINVIPCSVSSVKNKNDFKPTIMQPQEGINLLTAMGKYSNITTSDAIWLANSYPEQVGIVTTAARAVSEPAARSEEATYNEA